MISELILVTDGVLVEPEKGSVFTLRLSYDVGNPWAITMLVNGVDGCREWVFARQLLIDALAGRPLAIGDVVAWRVTDPETRKAWMHIKLDSGQRAATLAVAWVKLDDFLKATCALVQLGQETIPNFDDELEALLND